MKRPNNSQEKGAAMVFYLLLMFVSVSAIGGVLTYVSGTVKLEHRRSDMIAAQQFAQGGAVVAASELSDAIANSSGNLAPVLANAGYTKDTALSNAQNNVYKRTISAPFTNQTVQAQLWIPTASSFKTAKVVASATKGKVTQTAKVNLKMTWGYPAAIINTHRGTTATGYTSSVGKAGNVAIDGVAGSPLVVDGGDAKAILSNSRVNVDPVLANIPASSVSAQNYGTDNEIPDYTAQGTANALFDFPRFIAAADATPNPLNPGAAKTNHFKSLADFLKANALAAATPAKALEGIIVVDITEKDKSKDVGIDVLADPAKYVGTAYLPAVNPSTHGITVRGSVFFNFGPAYGPLDKIFNRLAMNINPANLTGLNPTNSATYPTGYPAVYTDPAKKPVNVNIAPKGFTNFTADEDLPAMMYSIGTLDMHGPVNISGVVYTPSYSEIENRPNEGFKIANQLQYIKGTVIVGMGIYFENKNVSRSIISYDENTLDSLATWGNAGKTAQVAYWE